MIDPEIGFTSDAIKDPRRFVGRTELIRRCVQGLNSPVSLLAIYGKRGVGKSSLLRQIQQLALGDYTLVKQAGLTHEIPQKPRTFLTIYYTCDSLITSGESLLSTPFHKYAHILSRPQFSVVGYHCSVSASLRAGRSNRRACISIRTGAQCFHSTARNLIAAERPPPSRENRSA